VPNAEASYATSDIAGPHTYSRRHQLGGRRSWMSSRLYLALIRLRRVGVALIYRGRLFSGFELDETDTA